MAAPKASSEFGCGSAALCLCGYKGGNKVQTTGHLPLDERIPRMNI
jgi:hypothetical protein